mgnify:CR=1 FL=1|nr:MAG TPA: hypothetical protein [Caudoviricetes sp.]
MKIIIDETREVFKETNKIGNDSENKVEVLEFEFPKQYTAFTKYIEFQIKNEKYVDLIENDQYVITRAIAKYGKIKAQVVLRNSLDNDVAVFKSNVFDLKVSNSLNATEDVPTEYPTWIDNLTKLKQDLESSESERISEEEERQKNFTEMQKTVENAVSNIKDLKEEYNSNAEKETKKFNDTAAEQTKTFNDNSDSKLAEYNKTHTDKMKEFNDNNDAKTKTFDANVAAKLEAYNKNDEAKISTYNANDKAKTDAYNANDKAKTDAYNSNTVLKEKAYNDNAATKTETFNSNVEQKENELEDLAEEKINEYSQVSAELNAKVEQVQAENEALKSENKLIKEQIPSASVSGNSVHVEDSSNLDFEWKINGNQYQATREGYNLIDTSVFTDRTMNGVVFKRNEDGSVKITGTSTAPFGIYLTIDSFVANGDYTYFVPFYETKGMNFSLGYNEKAIEGLNAQPQNKYGGNAHIIQKTLNNQRIDQLRIYIEKDVTVDYLLEWMLVKGTYTADTIPAYEQYGAMPSPDYPSKIETVGSNANLFDKDDVTVKTLINNSGTTQFNENWDLGGFIDVRNIENITFSVKTDLTWSQVLIAQYSDSKEFIKKQQINNSTQGTIKLESNTRYVRFGYRNDCNLSEIKLEKGTIATPSSPYRNG